MTAGEPKRRHPTRAAIDALAQRFGLPNDPLSQDWQYQVADAARLPEFLEALEREDFTDDERFTLSETVMECFEEVASTGVALDGSDEWRRFVALLRARPQLHASTLWYWSVSDSTEEDAFRVSRLVRLLREEIL